MPQRDTEDFTIAAAAATADYDDADDSLRVESAVTWFVGDIRWLKLI